MATARVRKLSRDLHRQRVHQRVRTRVEGTPERPRLCVYRSLGHIYAQVIDDRSGKTLVSASSIDAETKKGLKGGGNVAAAKVIGKIIAERAKTAGVSKVVFDLKPAAHEDEKALHEHAQVQAIGHGAAG